MLAKEKTMLLQDLMHKFRHYQGPTHEAKSIRHQPNEFINFTTLKISIVYLKYIKKNFNEQIRLHTLLANLNVDLSSQKNNPQNNLLTSIIIVLLNSICAVVSSNISIVN